MQLIPNQYDGVRTTEKEVIHLDTSHFRIRVSIPWPYINRIHDLR